MALTLVNNEGRVYFFRDRKKITSSLLRSFKVIEKQPNKVILLPAEKIDSVAGLSAALYKISPLMSQAIPKEVDGCEIVGIIVSPVIVDRIDKKENDN